MYSDTKRELQDLGDGLFAWVQGDGSWGWSNSGLITGADDKSLVVDTLFTGRLTEDMLAAYRRADPAAATIDMLVNTHSNGDHTFGNHLVGGARIIASEAARDEMEERPAGFFKAAAADPDAYGVFGEFLHTFMGKTFDFSDIEHVPPTEVFKGARTLTVGGRTVELTELGPAHTRGDVIVHVPDARVCFTGDLVFHGGHPIMWAGPVGNWIAACDHILGLDVDVIVPGHGAVSDKTAVRALRDYFVHILAQTTTCFEAGLSWEDAAYEVGYAAFDSWLDRERVVANVATIYRDLSGGSVAPEQAEVLAQMLRYSRGATCPHDEPCQCHKVG
ncbi:MBL fold metallo-hydrolase [Pukyongiella litopenaei]|uniref:MBL fold metallo-hydrolase n=1 Tax=Pukyongiella litopenaei TaxID=2605946 RepID=A0A2S0MSI8_9RHOB|nr:MBL fold metallo-hydrolase [Pukyongiella litopenaei]AVO38701.1 MBL fold metallo-hydrolase [Pukyongiella litopenaei]